EMISKQSRFVALVSLLMLLLEGGFALTNSGRASLAQTLRGVDPEQRRERLRNLQVVDVVSSPAGATTITDEDKAVKTNKASFPEGGSIVDKNRIAGISDYLYDGDINLTEEQLSALESELSSGTTRQKRQASKIYATWTDKKVFYYFDESLGEPMRALVRKTHAYLTARTCVTYKSRSSVQRGRLLLVCRNDWRRTRLVASRWLRYDGNHRPRVHARAWNFPYAESSRP
uniref:Peptidase M12A domain-containing protein n=1 Tax=Haemonchus contortus TaxID=6289 RepID=A0A7I4YK26_HAECO